MKQLHLFITVGVGIAAVAAFGAAALLFHVFQVNPQSGTEPESGIALAMDLNSTAIRTGQTMGMDISLTNTTPGVLTINPQHNWPLRKWSMGPCLFHLPFGMALMQGDYTLQNMTDGQRLTLYPRGVYVCKTIGIVDFVFQPSSSKATIETYNSTNISVNMQYHVAFNGYYDGQTFRPLAGGMYTVVGEDQWGHVILKHFTVGSAPG
ncbi:MAG TPA: hypothetical protein VJ792_02205 [Candidatus Nitrosotalea sp.]|nr:hypothetical protein [Candidatus Nitrosotalea sp.]